MGNLKVLDRLADELVTLVAICGLVFLGSGVSSPEMFGLLVIAISGLGGYRIRQKNK